jgi:MFS family permease
VFLAAGSATLALLAVRAAAPWMLYLVAAWMSAFSALQRPSMQAIGAKLLDTDEMSAGAALQMVGGSGAMIAGPAIGGIIISTWGLSWAYGFDVASYIASFVLLLGLSAMPPAADAEQPSIDGVIEGFRYARSRQELIGTYVVDFTAMVFGMPIALSPALADRFGGVRVLGMLYAAPAVGTMIAGATSSWTHRVTRHGRAVMVAAAVWGVAIVAFGMSRTLWPALFFLALAGGADAISAVFRLTLWNQTIPDELRGRLASIELVSYSSGPLLGHVEAGGVAAAFGLTASVISGGVLCVAGVLACALALPGFSRYDARAWFAAKEEREGMGAQRVSADDGHGASL